MIDNIFFGLILSALLGALVGVEREIRLQKEKITDFAGFRTYTLISVLGFLLGFLAFDIFENSYFLLTGIFGIFMAIIFAYRAVTKMSPTSVSLISEVSAIVVFIIGVLVSISYYYFAIFLSILLTGTLFLGNAFHSFAKHLKQKEMYATLKFAIISLIILPILPNENYSPLDFPIIGDILLSFNIFDPTLLESLDIFNFFYIWLMVVLISGIGYFGYIMMKLFGTEKGILFTGFLGGLMSSTALTSSFAIESRKLSYLSSPLIVGTVIASSIMFFRIIVEVAIINPSLLPNILLVFLIMGFSGILIAVFIFKRKRLNHVKKFNLKSPFAFWPAFKFGIFFVFILFLAKLFSILFGDSGIYLVAFFSGLADVDAITITLSTLSAEGSISQLAATIGIMIAAVTNTIFKGAIAFYLGSKEFGKGVMIAFGSIILIGIISLILTLFL